MTAPPVGSVRAGLTPGLAPAEDAGWPVAPAPALTGLPGPNGARVPPLLGLSPAAIRRLDTAGLVRLAADIRSFLIDAVASNGGHLGSNLGAVELTLALHKVFDSPRDRILWDTGHQAYVHKIVTGRAGDFAGLRRAAGLSGYPNRTESPHDLIENSHASTALSYAFGLARARHLHGGTHHVVAVVGDGALTGGLSYEALNNIGSQRAGVVIVLNDNGRSYARTVSPLTTAGRGASPSTAPAAFFEALGIGYQGPVDGHDLEALEAAIRRAAATTGPVVLHVHTVKGRGYAPAEQDEEKCLHDVGPFDAATGRPLKRPASAGTSTSSSSTSSTSSSSSSSSYTEAFAGSLLREAARHPEIVAITAAMPGSCGLLEFARRYPDRFMDVGIAEQHAVTAAAGMAMEGLRPVVTIYSTFLNRAWDQLYYDVGLHRLPVIFCIDRAGVTGDDGPSHNGVLDLALLTKVPGMTVLAPSSYEEVPGMFAEALAIRSGPVALRWPKTEARRSTVTGRGLSARRVRRGDRVCLLGLGKMVEACEGAARQLERVGVDATVWDVRAAAPLDPAMLRDALRHQVVLTAEDGVVEGGVGSAIASALRHLAGVGPLPTILPCGLPLAYFPQGSPADILAAHGLDSGSLAQKALSYCSER